VNEETDGLKLSDEELEIGDFSYQWYDEKGPFVDINTNRKTG